MWHVPMCPYTREPDTHASHITPRQVKCTVAAGLRCRPGAAQRPCISRSGDKPMNAAACAHMCACARVRAPTHACVRACAQMCMRSCARARLRARAQSARAKCVCVCKMRAGACVRGCARACVRRRELACARWHTRDHRHTERPERQQSPHGKEGFTAVVAVVITAAPIADEQRQASAKRAQPASQPAGQSVSFTQLN